MQQLTLPWPPASSPRLDNFLVGSNAAAVQALQQLTAQVITAAQKPLDGTASPAGQALTPCYLFGESGSGKTHLLRACAHKLQAAGLTSGWLDADGASEQEFNPAWAAIFLDDVDRYDGEQQQRAFHWFVQAMTPRKAGLCWVLSAGSDAPSQLTLRADLQSRMAWGEVHSLDLLAEAERWAVLRQAAQDRGLQLSDEVLRYMHTRFSRDLGSLMQLLDALDQYALQTQRNITVPLMRQMLEFS